MSGIGAVGALLRVTPFLLSWAIILPQARDEHEAGARLRPPWGARQGLFQFDRTGGTKARRMGRMRCEPICSADWLQSRPDMASRLAQRPPRRESAQPGRPGCDGGRPKRHGPAEPPGLPAPIEDAIRSGSAVVERLVSA